MVAYSVNGFLVVLAWEVFGSSPNKPISFFIITNENKTFLADFLKFYKNFLKLNLIDRVEWFKKKNFDLFKNWKCLKIINKNGATK